MLYLPAKIEWNEFSTKLIFIKKLIGIVLEK